MGAVQGDLKILEIGQVYTTCIISTGRTNICTNVGAFMLCDIPLLYNRLIFHARRLSTTVNTRIKALQLAFQTKQLNTLVERIF